MGEELVGKVTHFYDKISVAVVELSAGVRVGDRLKFKHAGEEFEQTVNSMQIEHDAVEDAKAGQSIGLKTVQPVHANTEVYRVTE